MKEKKNIERLFQERFRDFESEPPADVWKNISQKLHPEKEIKMGKKTMPLWAKLSGIVAALLIVFFVTDAILSDTTIQTPTDITHTETLPIQDEKGFELNSDNRQIVENNGLTQNEKNLVSQPQSDDYINEIQLTQDKIQKDKIQVTYSEGETKTAQNNTKHPLKTNHEEGDQLIDNSDLATTNLSEKERKTSLSENNNFTDNKTLISEKRGENENHLVLTENSEKSPKVISRNDSESVPKSANIFTDKQTSTDQTEDIAFENTEKHKGKTPNKLQSLEEKQTEKDKEEKAFSKWKITPFIAPVTMNSLSQGSPISEDLAANSKDYQTSVSYGVGVNYAITSKLNIRTGINKLTMGYNTNDIVVYVATKGSEVLTNQTNLILSGSNTNLVIKPEDALAGQEYTTSQKGYINQKLGYVEIPVELSYKLLDRRFGIDVVGGLSTLFLSENEVSIISNGKSMPLGEAGNLSNVHFSTNIGLGFRYALFSSFEASIEPMFKYQIGTFSRNDGNFKPYVLGLYTGLSFKF